MKIIDKFLDRITMYRLVVYVLFIYVGLAIVFSFLGKLAFTPTNIIISLALLLIPAFFADKCISWLFHAPTNSETWLITSLIMFLIIQPAHSVASAIGLALAGAVSSASKFLLARNNKHLFNPAAFGAALLSLTAIETTTWWIGNSAFWPFTLVFGFLVVRKIRRMPLFIAFIATSSALQLLLFFIHEQASWTNMKGALLASPLLFLSTIMLTEPATMPPQRRQQIIYAVIVAALYVFAWEIGPLVIYPEVALLLGNIYAYIVSPKFRVRLTLSQIQKISDQVYNYVFKPDKMFSFVPGQYMEWTLANVPYDSRGNRRTFTLASSPSEENVQVGLKYYQPASAYKTTFFNMNIGDAVYVSQLAGNFIIKPNQTTKLAFIAGGIGITPFRSMLKYLTDKYIERDIVLLYVVSTASEFAYKQDLLDARAIGLKVIPVVTKDDNNSKGVVSAKLSQNLIAQLIPDYAERTFYISGPSSMVDATKKYLHDLHISKRRVKTDHFSGY